MNTQKLYASLLYGFSAIRSEISHQIKVTAQCLKIIGLFVLKNDRKIN